MTSHAQSCLEAETLEWLSTVRPDGCSHVTPLIAVLLERSTAIRGREPEMEPKMRKATRAKGSFENVTWDEEICAELGDGSKLTRATVTQTFDGDIEGDGSVEWLMAYRANGTAHFVGLQRVNGAIGDRTGSFVLETIGELDGKVASWTAEVVSGSGVDGLVGLSGKGTFEAPHGTTASFELHLALAG